MAERQPIVVGNWKMNTRRASGVALAREVAVRCESWRSRVEVGVCPPACYLDAVGAGLRSADSPVMLGAQNVAAEPDGALTGEHSLGMLQDLGVGLVIVGHSERRHVLDETDEAIAKKVSAVLNAGLVCILCVGETLAQRRAGETDRINEHQVRAGLSLADPAHLPRLVIAYEPVWAIGTGQTASPADAQDAHQKIRSVLGALRGEKVAEATRVQYGGSVKPDNARELFRQPDIDGGLIGGASLDAAGFARIVAAAAGDGAA